MVELQKQEPLYGVCRYPIKSIVVPLYMGFLLEDRIEDSIIPDIDLSSLTVI